MSVPWTEIAALAAVAAVVVGRLNYTDTELERQNRIDNRIGDWRIRVEYEEVYSGNHPLRVPVVATDPEYDFAIQDILVTRKTGWQNILRTIVYGFQGSTRVDIKSLSWRVGSWTPEAPADFDMVGGFHFADYDVEAELNPDTATVRLEFEHADIDEIEETVDALFDYLRENLGNVPAVAYEEVH